MKKALLALAALTMTASAFAWVPTGNPTCATLCKPALDGALKPVPPVDTSVRVAQ